MGELASASRASVHPHARGEHRLGRRHVFGMDGSSPRPWGTLGRLVLVAGAGRFIPTPVGNTAAAPACRRSPSVHPHARGEHQKLPLQLESRHGSSPRPWGTLKTSHLCRWYRRFIPTPVGNTRWCRTGPARRSVHPHARGEHDLALQRLDLPGGSSPRPWGTPRGAAREQHADRFIPTPVGNTAHRTTGSPARPVHPHARGEHGDGDGEQALDVGSSPRPWGTLAGTACRSGTARFIPTPVGNTSAPNCLGQWMPVHPHARGEHAWKITCRMWLNGSSPRPWGTRDPRQLRR